jgi:hypothetical protein
VPDESVVPKMQIRVRKYVAMSLDERGKAWCNRRA